MTFDPGRATRAERLLTWVVFASFLAIAGFQFGRLGANLAFPADVASLTSIAPRSDFNDTPRPENTPTHSRVSAIFGAPEPKQTTAATAPAPIAASTSYGLRGITVVGSDRWAMLTADGANVLVRMGDQLPGGETVKEITPDAVLLSMDSKLTILEFSRSDSESPPAQNRPELMADFAPTARAAETPRVTTVTPTAPAPRLDVTELERPALNMQTLRRAIYAPNALSNVHFTRGRTQSGQIGWTLKWIKDSPLVEAAGLQRGDILVTINKVSVGDSDALQSLLLGLGKLDTIEIEYERRKRPMRVTIPLIKS